MSVFIGNIFLALVWAAATKNFSLSGLVGGYALSFGILWFLQPVYGPTRYFIKIRQALAFVLFFVYELILSNLRVAYAVLTPSRRLKPGVIRVALEARGELEITLLACFISLTPGSLSLDISEDQSTLYVHAMHIEDPEALRREIKEGFERRLLELLR